MGLFLKQNEPRNELQTKVAAELQERLKERNKIEHKPIEPQIDKSTHETNPLGIILIVVGLLLIIGTFVILVSQ